MACSTGAQKITLQVISSFYLIVAVLSIVMGIVLLANADQVSKKSTLTLKTEQDTLTAVAKFLSYYLLIIGTLMALFSIFGIYSVAKERAGKVKAYGIIHVVMLVLNIIALFLSPNGSVIFSILLSGGAAYLSFQLAQQFSSGRSGTINSV